MVALRIGPDQRMAVIGAPGYFDDRKRPVMPQDLADHACINLRLLSAGGFFAWQFENGGQQVRVRVDGQLAFNGATMIVRAATPRKSW